MKTRVSQATNRRKKQLLAEGQEFDSSNAVLTCVLGGAVVAEGKNRDAQISQVENNVRPHGL